MKSLFSCAIAFSLVSVGYSQAWYGYGANPQHTGQYTGSTQSVSKIHWSTSLDDNRSYYGDEVLIHYASPMVTKSNTVLYGYRYTTTVNGSPDYDNWSVIARTGSRGTLVYRLDTDYSAVALFPNDWTSVYPVTLAPSGGNTSLVAGAAGGSLMVKTSADVAGSATNREVFYTTLSDFNANQAAYSGIKIASPLTADNQGNVYFSYTVTATSSKIPASLGTGGFAKVNVATGAAVYKSISSLGIANLYGPALNASPAVSNDGNFIYVAATGNYPYLIKLNVQDFSVAASTPMTDPSVVSQPVSIYTESSASPMVGPDGHVFMGVMGNQWRESHGWMMQYDANLRQTDPSGKLYPVGAFGWDDTGSVVPSNIVPTYRGTSPYLILTKYNNYDDNGGDPGADGSNKVAVLDPGSNSVTKDRQTGIPVMNEVLTVLGPTKTNDDPNHPNATNEWCINSAAIDIKRKGAIINSEDGHMYRWDFTSNKLTQALDLAPATGEAYTSTTVGPDGQMYAINNSILFAVGDPALATAVSVYQGTAGIGTLQDIWYVDGMTYSTFAVQSSAGQVAAIEADFTLPVTSINGLTVSATASAVTGSTGYLYAYNYTTKQFVLVSAGTAMGPVQTALGGSTTTNGSQFLGPNGAVRTILRVVLPGHVSPRTFKLSADQIVCGYN